MENKDEEFSAPIRQFIAYALWTRFGPFSNEKNESVNDKEKDENDDGFFYC